MTTRRYLMQPRHRLRTATEFRRVFSRGDRHDIGPLTVRALPSNGENPRIGFAISRRVGNAVVRNRIRRRLREAFRLSQHDVAATGTALDIVISVRPHAPLPFAEYQRLLARSLRAIRRRASERSS